MAFTNVELCGRMWHPLTKAKSATGRNAYNAAVQSEITWLRRRRHNLNTKLPGMGPGLPKPLPSYGP